MIKLIVRADQAHHGSALSYAAIGLDCWGTSHDALGSSLLLLLLFVVASHVSIVVVVVVFVIIMLLCVSLLSLQTAPPRVLR